MEFSHLAKFEEDILLITTKGTSESLEKVKEFSKEMMEYCLKNSCNRILKDDRNQEILLTNSEVTELGEFHASHMPAIIKLAVVVIPNYLKKMKLWESTVFSRGGNVKVFSDFERAKKWLKGE